MRALWVRSAAVAAALVAGTLLAFLVLPLGVRGAGARLAEAASFLLLFGWWLYLPGVVAYALAVPALARRAPLRPRAVALALSPLIAAVPLTAGAAVALSGALRPDGQPLWALVALVLGPALLAGAVVPVRSASRPAP